MRGLEFESFLQENNCVDMAEILSTAFCDKYLTPLPGTLCGVFLFPVDEDHERFGKGQKMKGLPRLLKTASS